MGWWLVPAGLLGLMGGLALVSRNMGAAARPPRWLRGSVPLPLAALAGVAGAVILQSSSLCVAAVVAATDGTALGVAPGWAAIAGANVGATILPHLVAWAVPWWLLAAIAAGGGALALHPRTARPGRIGLGMAMLLAGFRCLALGLPPGAGPVAAWLLRPDARSALLPFGAGLLLTAALFSSHFTIAAAQGLAASGVLGPVAGIAFVAGANVGTTADVLFASLGTGRRGRATALFHLGFNVILAALALVTAVPFAALLTAGATPPARLLAHAHTGLNLATALIVLPFIPGLAARLEPASGRDP